MKSATLTVNAPFLLAPAARRRTPASRASVQAPGLFARLDRETAAGSLPEAVVFALLALTGAAWPTYEALRLIAGF